MRLVRCNRTPEPTTALWGEATPVGRILGACILDRSRSAVPFFRDCKDSSADEGSPVRVKLKVLTCGVNELYPAHAGRAKVLVGVLGGGLQGCCAALALAERNVRVVLFDENEELLSRAARFRVKTSIKMNDAATQVSSFEATPERPAFF